MNDTWEARFLSRHSGLHKDDFSSKCVVITYYVWKTPVFVLKSHLDSLRAVPRLSQPCEQIGHAVTGLDDVDNWMIIGHFGPPIRTQIALSSWFFEFELILWLHYIHRFPFTWKISTNEIFRLLLNHREKSTKLSAQLQLPHRTPSIVNLGGSGYCGCPVQEYMVYRKTRTSFLLVFNAALDSVRHSTP